MLGWLVRCAYIALAFVSCLAHAQMFDEARDAGVAPSAELRLDDHASPTPLEIPGARIIVTAELRERLEAPLESRPLLFDVLGGEGHLTIPGAIWLPGAGRGASFEDEVQARLAKLLDLATRGTRGRQLVFFLQRACLLAVLQRCLARRAAGLWRRALVSRRPRSLARGESAACSAQRPLEGTLENYLPPLRTCSIR